MPSNTASSPSSEFLTASPTSSGPAAPAPVLDTPAAPAISYSGVVRAIRTHRLEFIALLLILVLGSAMRVLPYFGKAHRRSVDEMLYVTDVGEVHIVGPFQYPAIVQSFIKSQQARAMVMLPPTRFSYIILGWLWSVIFGTGDQFSLLCVAAMFSIFCFILAGFFTYRLAGIHAALVVSALMTASPMELMFAHHELVDGVFAFWALLSLWLLWENMQRPGRLGWLAAYAGALAGMILTKENAFFAVVGLCGIMGMALAFPRLKLGTVDRTVIGATIVGGLLGVAVLVCIAGSPRDLIEVYRLVVTKAEHMQFAYETGGGPWFRYIVDLLLISPVVTLAAVGGVFSMRADNRQGFFLLIFVVFSCAVMVNVKNGMNVRYATMWDMPLRFFAAMVILRIARSAGRWQIALGVALVCLVAGMELHQYFKIFVAHDLDEPITKYLMYALDIVRVQY